MKRTVLVGSLLTLAATLIAAESSPKDDVAEAAKKLSGADNYSWKATVEFGNFTGTTDGKTDKDGLTSLSMTFGDNTTDAFLKTGKGAVKAGDQGWQSLAEMEANTEQGPARFLLRRLQTFKTPSKELTEISEKVKELKKDGEVYSGDLTEEGAKDQLSFGRRGGNGPKNAKGSLKVWVKAGTVTKFVVTVSGTVNFNGEDRDVDRTTTTEIKDVGTTKIEVPEPAKKKLG